MHPVVRPAKSTGGSPHLSAISRQTLPISVRTSNTTQVHQHDATQAIGQLVEIALPHQGPLLLLDPDAGKVCISRSARRLLPLAPQVSQIGNAALIERETATLPLDHTVGCEFADVGQAAIEVHRQCGHAGGRGLSGWQSRARLGDGRSITATFQSS